MPGLPVPIGKNKTVLVVDAYAPYNGTAMLAGPYAVIKYHVISTLTLVHELGHTFGATHLKAYQFTNGRYTVMAPFAYGTLREPIYSNPKFNGLVNRQELARFSMLNGCAMSFLNSDPAVGSRHNDQRRLNYYGRRSNIAAPFGDGQRGPARGRRPAPALAQVAVRDRTGSVFRRARLGAQFLALGHTVR